MSTKAFLALIEGVMLIPVEGRVSRRDFTLREIEEGRSDSANKVTFALEKKLKHSLNVNHKFLVLDCILELFYPSFQNLFQETHGTSASRHDAFAECERLDAYNIGKKINKKDDVESTTNYFQAS